MYETLAAVEAWLAGAGRLWTRLREQGAQDVLDLMPCEAFALPGCTSPAVVAALLTLEQRGVVQRGHPRVHPHDSSEYHVVWRLAREAPHRPARP